MKLYENIGRKIQILAIILAVLMTLGAVLTAILLITKGNALMGLLYLIAGPLSAWIASWLLYGFGKIVESSEQIDSIQYTVSKISKTLDELKAGRANYPTNDSSANNRSYTYNNSDYQR